MGNIAIIMGKCGEYSQSFKKNNITEDLLKCHLLANIAILSIRKID